MVTANRTTIQWDAGNRLTKISTPSGRVAEQGYRNDGLRVSQFISQAGAGPEATSLQENYIWESDTPLLWRSDTASYARFLSEDTTTQGNWASPFVYGSDGYYLPTGATPQQVVPNYLEHFIISAGGVSWAPSTTDVRALKNPATSFSTRFAAATTTASGTGSFTYQIGGQWELALFAYAD